MDKGEISKQQYDAAKANADATASALKAEQEKIAQATSAIDIAKAQLNAARARVEQARAGVSSARADVQQVSMRTRGRAGQARKGRAGAREGGSCAAQFELHGDCGAASMEWRRTSKWRSDRSCKPGQGLLVVVPLQDVWVTANFKETQLRKMRRRTKSRSESGHLRENIQLGTWTL